MKNQERNFHFTIHRDTRIDGAIQKHLDFIVKELLNYKNKLGTESVILVGGFGRGEGSVIKENEHVKPLNDYDLLIITNKLFSPHKLINNLSKRLAEELNIDFVDISTLHQSKLGKLQPTVFNYDIKYGSQVIYGDKSVLDKIPNYEPEDVPLWEGIRLLFNRMAGMLGGLSIEYFSRQLSIKEKRYLINQINHLIIAWIDVLNLSKSRYSHSYQEKLEIFRELYHLKFKELFLDNNLLRYAEKAIKFKLTPSYDIWDRDLLQELFSVIDITKDIYVYGMECYLNKHFNELLDIPQEYLRHQKSDISSLWNTYYLLKLYKQKMLHWNVLKHINYLLNQFVYISLPYILFSIRDKGEIDLKILEKGGEMLSNITKIKPPHNSKKKWEYVRKKSFGLWEVLCH
jgi:hypothetical protein